MSVRLVERFLDVHWDFPSFGDGVALFACPVPDGFALFDFGAVFMDLL